MTSEEKIIKNKVGLVKLAQTLGNVSQACKVMGYSCDSFYRFKELYESMTQLVKSQLGLMKAFKYTLDIEKAATVPELLEIARRFAADVEAAKGETAAAMVRRALGLGD